MSEQKHRDRVVRCVREHGPIREDDIAQHLTLPRRYVRDLLDAAFPTRVCWTDSDGTDVWESK